MLITGGGRGIGAATAVGAAGRGYDVAVNYVSDRASAERVISACRAWGVRALAIQADVSDEADVTRMFEHIDTEFGSIDCLVNNAAIVAPMSRVDSLDADRVRRLFDVNVVGTLLCAREAILRMSTQHGGRGGVIINVSSAAARHASPGEYVDYAATKGAVDTITVGLAKEVAAEGIRVNAVRPGIIETDIHRESGMADRLEQAAATIPMGRLGTPDEVAGVIVFLAAEAHYMTGAIVDVGGGR